MTEVNKLIDWKLCWKYHRSLLEALQNVLTARNEKEIKDNKPAVKQCKNKNQLAIRSAKTLETHSTSDNFFYIFNFIITANTY